MTDLDLLPAPPAAILTPAGLIRYEPVPPGSDFLLVGPRARVHWMRSEFDCFRCVLATVLECEYEPVPAPPDRELSRVEELDALETLHAWVRARGLRMHYREVTRAVFNRFWIGVSVDPRPGWDHTVVCFCRSLVFDPALAVPVPAGCAVEPVRRLDYAITFDRLEDA